MLWDREAFSLCGKREGRGTAWSPSCRSQLCPLHPEKALVIDPDDYPLPPHIIRWPDKSPGQRAVPFEVFSLHLPLIAWRNLATSGEVEEVGGGAIGETHDKREEAPRAEVSDLVSDLPTVVIKC